MSAETAHSDRNINSNETRVFLDRSTIGAIHKHALETYPEECCGLLLGKFEENSRTKRVLGSRRMANVFAKEERYHRYSIDPMEFMKVESDAESSNMDVVGIYHSHPNAPSKPSEFDKGYAWPSLSYIVVEVRDSNPVSIRSWLLKDDRSEFLPEEMLMNNSG